MPYPDLKVHFARTSLIQNQIKIQFFDIKMLHDTHITSERITCLVRGSESPVNKSLGLYFNGVMDFYIVNTTSIVWYKIYSCED